MGVFWVILAGLGGACAANGLRLLAVPPSSINRHALQGVGVIGVLLGLAAIARAATSCVDQNSLTWMYRASYILLSAAALTAIVAGFLASHGRGMKAASMVGVLLWISFGVAALTPAFPELGPGELGPLDFAVTWAYPCVAVYTLAGSMIAGASSLRPAFGKGPRPVRMLHRGMLSIDLGIALSIAMVVAVDLQTALGNSASLLLLACYTLATVGLFQVGRSNLVWIERSMDDLRAEAEKTFEFALRDPLTGLYNRAYFLASLNKALLRLRREEDAFAVCLLDLDDFKHINDTYGHRVGDLALLSVAKVLMRECRPYDTVARYGGEEFVILFENTSEQDALRICGRLRQSIADMSVPAAHHVVRVTATFGVVAVDRPVARMDDVMELVDRAMYEGKRLGKNQVRLARLARER